MHPERRVSVLILGLLAAQLASEPGSLAQRAPQAPHIGYVFPAGGQRGTVFEVLVGGQYLTGAKGAIVSGEGVETEVVDFSRPLTPKEVRGLRSKLQKVRERLEIE